MIEKSTKNLEEVLGSTHRTQASQFLEDHEKEMYTDEYAFSIYMKNLIYQKNLTQQRIFIDADIPERYGYKLLAGEKKTRQRDILLRICYAARFTLAETQRALKIYELPQLYAKIPRDALLMIAFNDRPGSIIEVNVFLTENGAEPLRSCGIQE